MMENPNPTATGEGLPGLKKQVDLEEKKEKFLKLREHIQTLQK